MKDPAARDTLPGFLRDLDSRTSRQERHTHHSVGRVPPATATFISSDPFNDSRLGSDSGIYTREIVAKATEPTPLDYGGFIKPGNVWVQLGATTTGGAWCDYFERADLGPDWTVGPTFSFGSFVPVVENALDGHAFIAGENDNPVPEAVMGTIRTTAEWPGDQVIEAKVGNFFQGNDPSMDWWFQWVEGDMWLFTQVVGGTSNACLGVYIIIQLNSSGDHGQAYMQLITVADDGTRTYLADGWISGPPPGWESNPDYTVRLETTAAGHCKAFFEGALLVEADLPPTGGTYVGAALQWGRTNYASTVPNPGTSPWYSQICIGAGEEGGPTELWAWDGTQWLLGPVSGWDGTAWVPAIATYQWDGSGWQQSVT